MPQLCFKVRKNSRTAQLVRHVYDARIGRSRTVSIGSMPLDADPEDLFHDLRLREGSNLGEDEYRQIANFLAAAGDASAARRRLEVAQRIEARVRAEMKLALEAKPGDVLAQAVTALEAVTTALPGLAAQAQADGKPVRGQLRPGYLEINAAWGRLLEVAQAVGVAKQKQKKP